MGRRRRLNRANSQERSNLDTDEQGGGKRKSNEGAPRESKGAEGRGLGSLNYRQFSEQEGEEEASDQKVCERSKGQHRSMQSSPFQLTRKCMERYLR